MVQDINFSKKVYLSFRSEDINSWTALIAKFGSEDNLIKSKFFFNSKSTKSDEGFELNNLGMGRISPSGKYVAPTGPDCEDGELINESPGVWDLENQKRVTFKITTDSNGVITNTDEILRKCENIVHSGKK